MSAGLFILLLAMFDIGNDHMRAWTKRDRRRRWHRIEDGIVAAAFLVAGWTVYLVWGQG